MAKADFKSDLELEEEPYHIKPYLFEPEYTEEELRANEGLWEPDKQRSSQQ